MVPKFMIFEEAALRRGEEAAMAAAALLAAFMLAGVAAFVAQHGVLAGEEIARAVGPVAALALFAAVCGGLYAAVRRALRQAS